MQDTIKPITIVPKDTIIQLSDSINNYKIIQKDSAAHSQKSVHSFKNITIPIDITSVCKRSPITDITFSNSHNIISENKFFTQDQFPFLFMDKNIERQQNLRASIQKHLRRGEILPARFFHDDWIIIIIFIVTFLYTAIRVTSKNLLPEIIRFFLFRGINDPVSRDFGALFNWQTTILNLCSFISLSLFGYFTLAWYDILPTGSDGIVVWLISFLLIVTGITLRHFICIITGIISGKREVYREYLLGVYQSYRFSAAILFVIVILISYTHLLSIKTCFLTGFFVLVIMYLIRITRLYLIFINRNISIFYLILYLCALEIMPVLILFKYSAGLV
jgi:hypothetical protein